MRTDSENHLTDRDAVQYCFDSMSEGDLVQFAEAMDNLSVIVRTLARVPGIEAVRRYAVLSAVSTLLPVVRADVEALMRSAKRDSNL